MDAFDHYWGDEALLLVPPVPMILRCLTKLMSEGGRGIMVIPTPNSVAWEAVLKGENMKAGLVSQWSHRGQDMLECRVKNFYDASFTGKIKILLFDYNGLGYRNDKIV